MSFNAAVSQRCYGHEASYGLVLVVVKKKTHKGKEKVNTCPDPVEEVSKAEKCKGTDWRD